MPVDEHEMDSTPMGAARRPRTLRDEPAVGTSFSISVHVMIIQGPPQLPVYPIESFALDAQRPMGDVHAGTRVEKGLLLGGPEPLRSFPDGPNRVPPASFRGSDHPLGGQSCGVRRGRTPQDLSSDQTL